jgi:hypothetical protein
MKESRHYHSSCCFNNKWVYVFGGIENSSKKYSNTMERLHVSFDYINNPWESVKIKSGQMINARQGSGMAQFSSDEIMLVGGFNGNF